MTQPEHDGLQLNHGEAFTRLLLDSTTEAFYAVDTEGKTTLCNVAFLQILGFENEAQVVGRKLHDVIHHSRPDGSHYAVDDCPIYQAAAKGINPGVIADEYFFRSDGTRLPVEYRAAPIIDRGILKGAICTFVDISERRNAEDRHALLVRELDHRVKNLFTMISGIVTLSARTAHSVADLKRAILGRVAALATAHSLIRTSDAGSQDAPTATSLRMLLETVLAPHLRADADGSSGVILQGPGLPIDGAAITSLSLVFHELATNAAKYGALSVPEGLVTVVWVVDQGRLALTWTETGGPSITQIPDASGFGTTLAERSVVGHLKGNLRFLWNAIGMVVTIEVPTDILQA